MTVRWVTGFFDAPSVAGELFWREVTGYGVSARWGSAGEFATLVPGGGDAYLRTQVVGGGPARMHLDLHVEGVAEQRRRLVGLGAVAVDEVVMRSPAGVLFCVVPWRGERVRPAPSVHGSFVDQLCLDVPAAGFEAERGFWVAATGWVGRSRPLPEFVALDRGEAAPGRGLPLRLMLQRVGGSVAGVHADLACVDRGSEARRHVALGAEFVREGDGWTTLRDPAGREYCVTEREPFST